MTTLIDYRNQENRHNTFIYEQMWFGPGTPVTRYAFVRPNVGDQVTHWGHAIYRVAAVDTDGIPTLELQSRLKTEPNSNIDSTSLITAISVYQPGASARAFYNPNVVPATLNIDARAQVFESSSTFMRLFRGNDISAAGEVVSALYNSDGTFNTNDIPLVEVTPGDPTRKRPGAFNASQALTNGELVTMVTYDASSRVTGTWAFLVVNSAAVMDPSNATVYLEDVELVSSLLSATDDRLIENRVNTQFNTNLVQCRLKYSDGSSQLINVDGTKCILHGVENFNTSQLGDPKTVVLAYYPDPGTEPFINAVGGARPFLAKDYKLANIVYDTSINLKLYPVPTYIDPTNGYTFSWYLTNLDGDLYMDVTADVLANTGSGSALSGIDYGTEQNTTLAIAMNDIGLGGVYADHIHTQTIDITVTIPGTPLADPWVIDYVGDGNNLFGASTYVSTSNVASGTLNLSQGSANQADWLAKIYQPSIPLYDITVQSAPTVPTHFRLEYGGTSTEHDISEWNTNITKAATAPVFTENQTINVVWINRVSGGDKVLAVSPLVSRVDL